MKEEKRRVNGIDCFIMDCISYTVAVLVLAGLSLVKIVQNMDVIVLLQLFVCTSIISIIMYAVSYVTKVSGWKAVVIGLIDGIVIVLAVGGGLLHWFPWKYQYVLMVLLIFIFTYLISYGIQFLDNRAATEKINQMIKRKSEK